MATAIMSENPQDGDGWTTVVRKNPLPPTVSNALTQRPKFGLLSTKSPQILERIPATWHPGGGSNSLPELGTGGLNRSWNVFQSTAAEGYSSILKDERFLVQVRQDKHLTRDILFYPKPAEFQVSQMTLLKSDGTPAKKYETNVNISKVEQIEIKIPFVEIWPGHFENEAMVRSEEMWSFALEAISKLTSISGVNSTHELVTEVAFNFGNWESKLYDDYRSLECHGHGHLILTEGGQRALSNHSEIGRFFRGRYNDPFQYDLEDAENLDSSRLSLDRLDRIDAHLDKMDARLDKMDARFDKHEANIDEMKSLLIRPLGNQS
ncbi:hypothetical protein BKA69DRAFT_1128844 [Paraphysoderma sedebokerense]|nr:hypothetical protein BKA69DRAFT_1128844 [Paraphysoderma sedebokerense]